MCVVCGCVMDGCVVAGLLCFLCGGGDWVDVFIAVCGVSVVCLCVVYL